MIARLNRFTNKIFGIVFRRSRHFKLDGFLFKISPARPPAPRLAVVVSKKNCKLAVKRNRIRRQAYEIMRKYLLDKSLDKNVIFLYKGGEIFTEQEKFKQACLKLQNLKTLS